MNGATDNDKCGRRGLQDDHDSVRRLTVFYDGECPMCRIEVEFYRRIDLTTQIIWQDLTKLSDDDLPAGKTRKQLLGIFHVRYPDGEWKTGVDAFGAIWSRLPVFRHFAWLFRVPILRQIAEVFYRLFLTWQRNARARRHRLHTDRDGCHPASG